MQLATVADAMHGASLRAASLLLESYLPLSRQAATAAITMLWQGAMIAAGLALYLRLTPRIGAAHRWLVWAAGFATIASLPLVPLLARLGHASAIATAQGTSAVVDKPWLQLDARWSIGIAAIWLVASLYRAVDLGVHTVRLRTLWKSATPLEHEDLAAALQGLRHGRIRICVTKTLERPSVIGFWAPRILIPEWLLSRLSDAELSQVVLHEAEHLRRRDDWTNLLQKICLIVFPLNPALLWIERRLCQEREMACDEGVIRVTRAPRAYAACLASLAERGLQRRVEALSLGAWQRRSELVERVHSILRSKSGFNPAAARATLFLVTCGLLIAATGFASCPQLIAFVSSQPASANIAQGVTHIHAAVAQVHVNSGMVRSTPVKRRALSFHTAETKPFAVSNASAPRFIAVDTAQEQTQNTLADNAARMPRIKLASAEARNFAPAVNEQQSWILLTTWEQIDTTSAGSQRSADYETPRSTSHAFNGETNTPNSTTAQWRVTQLVLRVLPSRSSSNPIAYVRSDWFAIQL